VPEPKASELVRRISDGSLQRLVFMVRPTEGWIRFDLTPLKEFMAAEALMTGPDNEIRDRLKAVAPVAYWRNVLLFAVGKCFVEKEYLLDNVVSICEGLNDDKAAGKLLDDELAGEASKATLWGSRLALDILADGTARQNPGYQSRLAKTALELVRLVDPELAAQLAAIYHEDMTGIFREVIADRLGQSDFWKQLGAWLLLMSLADQDVPWAMQIVEERWPSDITQQEKLLLSRRANPMRPWWVMKLIQVLPHCDPRSFFHRIGRPDLRDIQSHDYPDWWPAAIAVLTPRFGIRSEREIERIEIPNKSDILRSHPVFRLTPVGQKTLNPLENLQNFPFSHHEWAPLVAAARFCGNPTPEVLKKELEWLADNWQAKHMPPWFWLRFIPWPMAACLLIVQADDDFKQLARRAGAGQLGTREVWEAAEMRWLNQGISNDDFHAMIANDGWPFTERIAERGFPFIASTPALEEGNPPSRIEETFHQARQIPPSRMRGWLASLMLQQLMEYYYREIPVTINLADY